MKRSIKRFLLLSIFLIAISLVVIIFMGNIYTTSFRINDSNYEFSISNNDVIEVIDKQDRDGLYVVTVKAKRPGVVDLNMNYGDFSSIKKLYIHKTMVITSDNFFGYSRGSEIIPISLSILLGYLLFLFITRYRRSVKENIYQIWKKPPVYMHGDFHPGNLIYMDNGTIGVIDFNRWEVGDPYEEFYKLDSFGVELSIPYCIGQIDAYFEDNIPKEFWKANAVYVAHTSLFSITWAEQFGQKDIDGMVRRANKAFENYDDFTKIIPKWYTNKYQGSF